MTSGGPTPRRPTFRAYDRRNDHRLELLVSVWIPALQSVQPPSSRTAVVLLGLDHRKLTYLHQGREQRLTDVGGDNDLAKRLIQ